MALSIGAAQEGQVVGADLALQVADPFVHRLDGYALAALMRNAGQLVTYAQLAEAVWAVTTGPESNSLEVHVSRIRQKLEQEGGSRLIHTVRGLGYRFNADHEVT